MGEILIKAFSFILIIIIGYTFKKKGIFGQSDYKIITKIIMNITLPCTLITGFQNFNMNLSLVNIVFLGLICNLIMAGIGYIVGKNEDSKGKAFNMLNLSGYNIGCFTLPFVQSFLGTYAVGITSLFDIGNSIMCTGGTYALASGVVGEGEKQSIKGFLKKIFSSVPFDTYLLMFIVTLCEIKLPNSIYTITSNLSAGNAFLSMLMIGMIFELKIDTKRISKIFKIIGIRFFMGAVLSVVIYCFAPFSVEIKKVLVILIFSPIPVLAPVFTGKCNCDEGFAAVINSLCIPISITIIITLLSVWQI